MKSTSSTVSNVLTAIKAPTTNPPENTTNWCAVLKLQHFNDPSLLNLANSCGQWLTAIRTTQPGRWLSLVGSCGSGKTHCAKRLYRILSSENPRFNLPSHDFYPQFIHWPSLISDLRAGNSFSLLADARRWPFLFLDEIGAERDPSGFAAEQLCTLLCSRVGRWTCLTSNLTIPQFERIDTRIASRLFRDSSIVVEINAPDFAFRPKLPPDPTPTTKTSPRAS